MPITTGTKTADTRSASRCTGALPACACVTSRAICASWVSAPTLVTRTRSEPLAFTQPPVTGSPGDTSAGSGSPVSIEVSTAERPWATIPSAAIFSPGRMTITSPTASCETGTRVSVPSLSTAASLAPRDNSARSASPDRRRERPSR